MTKLFEERRMEERLKRNGKWSSWEPTNCFVDINSAVESALDNFELAGVCPAKVTIEWSNGTTLQFDQRLLPDEPEQ